jgi:hypothetical protein
MVGIDRRAVRRLDGESMNLKRKMVTTDFTD